MENIFTFLRKHIFILLIIIFGLVFLLPFYRNDFYVSHDATNILAKSAETFQAFSDGHFPPRWAGSMNYEYGVPVLSFAYPLGNYLVAFIRSIGLGFELTYKILVGLFFVLSGISFYFYLSSLLKKVPSLAGAVLYMLAPYHFLDIFVRGHLGELIVLSLAPLILYLFEKNRLNNSALYVAVGGLLYGFLILSHNILALIFSIVFGLYIIFFCKNTFLKNFLVLLLGLGLSAYFWIPALYETRYINSEVFVGGFFADHFIYLKNLIYSTWGFGPNINESGGLSPHIGIIHTVLILGSLLALKVKEYRKQIIFWLGVLLISIFFTNEASSFIWHRFHILEQFQFPWRFVAIASFAAAVLGGYAVSLIKKNIFIYLIVGLVLLTGISYMQVAGFTNKSDEFYLNYPGTGAYHGESTTIWTAGDASSYPDSPVEIIAGEGEIINYERKSHIHKFDLVAETDVRIKDNTTYYPGWRAFVDGKEVDVQFQDSNHRGLITFDVPEGEHNIKVKFTETTVRMTANILSIISFSLLLILFLFRNKLDKLVNKI